MQEEHLARKRLELAVKGLVPKEELRNLVVRIVLASTPWSQYHKIDVPTLLVNNSKYGGLNLQKIIVGLEVLEKYGKNLMKSDRPSQWRTVRLSNSVFKNKVDTIVGARDILQLLGYTKRIEDGYTFPDMFSDPNVQEVLAVTSDIVLLKLELSMLLKNAHPKNQAFLPYYKPMQILQQYPNTSLPFQENASTQITKETLSLSETDYEIDEMCAVCGQTLAEFRCSICNKLQCEKCDKIWHQNPNRVKHLRSRFRPLLPASSSAKSTTQQGVAKKSITSETFQGSDDKTNWEKKIMEKAVQLLDVKDMNTRHDHLNQFCLEIDEQIGKYKNGSKRLGNSSLQLSRHLLESAESLKTAKEELVKLVYLTEDKNDSFLNLGTSQSILVDIDLTLPGVRGPPSSVYIPFSPSSVNMQVGPVVSAKSSWNKTESFQKAPSHAVDDPMTLEDILFKTEAEDHRLRCNEMVDFLREAEGLGCDPLLVESFVANYLLELPTEALSEWLRKKLNAEAFQAPHQASSEKKPLKELIGSSKQMSPQMLGNENNSALQQFQKRIGKNGRQHISDFLKMENKLHMQHALMATFSLESESIAVMVSALLCHTCDKVPFLTMTNCDFNDVIEAAQSFPDNLDGAVKYLKNQCMLCLEIFARSKVECMTTCGDNECKYCHTCLERYLQYKISEGHIRDIVCPVCGLPDIDGDEETSTNYFNYLDVVVRTRLNDSLHTLFQQKLRDQTLMKMPNFRWCSFCTNGFLFEHEETTLKMVCPSCNKATCYNCKKQWEVQHEGISCEEFLDWKRMNDPDFQTAGLAAHLKENGIDCPSCKFRYALAKGGCMHFKCLMCSFQFCSGCKSPFRQGKVCTLLLTCRKKGLHAHHPRDCLFYLRDMEIEKLQEILNKSNVQFDSHCVTTNMYCQVSEQKETSTGLVDDFCGREVHDENVGLCKLHYKEYLVNLINDNKLDPAHVFSIDELITCLNRVESFVPKRTTEMSEKKYAAALLLQVQKLPLTFQRVGIGQNTSQKLS